VVHAVKSRSIDKALRKALGLILVLVILAIPIPGGLALGQSGGRALQSLIEAERAFSRLSEEKGIREAFLTYLADDSIVFRPRPVPGRKVYEVAADEPPVLLTWEPAYAEVAPDGDLGYTTGPYQVKDRNKPAEPARYGHYVSLWQRQPSGLWRVVVDVGIRHPQPGFRPLEVMTRKETSRPQRPVKVDRFSELNKLLKVEADFSAKAAAEGVPAAYTAFAQDDIRTYRDGSLPQTGIEAIRQAVSKGPGQLTWEPMDGDVSRWGTLGFIFGTVEAREGIAGAAATSSSYLRIWRKTPDGQWKIALDLAVPMPPEEKR
jgi:ketosteroid isomerase-like protein